ncbi:hypothetical protein PR048_005173 [Dryococelus australis]|uniref:Uncharacterized protein n=1 Tax=Dryococelus australis TaxID=614101 RepID=A0ABQ9I7G9_9NEOP|nr:hypothetical protein PR048_005173 [Dryococelus australis]
MLQLEDKMEPDGFQKFAVQGFFTIHRSNKFWSGVLSDMTIEQVIIRSIKSTRGLTHGHGVSPATRSTRIHGVPIASRVVDSVEEFGGVLGASSEQHTDLRLSRQNRDRADINLFINWLHDHNPFQRFSADLVSFSSGNTVGTHFFEVHYRRSDKVKCLENASNAVRVHNEEILINPNQLFH